jgi:hypothetical protein
MKTLLLSLLFLFITATPAQAHVLITDGTIGAVLHVDPEDDPIAGARSNFFFEFKDKQNKFKSENCDCTFTIKENDNVIFTQPLFQNTNNPSLNNASVSFTFPKRDIYEVSVVGKPHSPGAFQPFTLTYDIRVERTADGVSSAPQSWIATHIVQLIGGVLVLGFLLWFLLKKKTPLRPPAGGLR